MDDFEREVSRTLGELVAGMPSSYDAPPEVLERARRRRAKKVSAIVASAVIFAAGTTAAVAQVVGHHDTERVVTTGPTSTTSASAPGSTVSTTETSSSAPARASVTTVACPITYATIGETPFPAPSTASRAPAAGDPAVLAHLRSYAATTDPRYVVLGPQAWSCRMEVAGDGDNGFLVYPPGSPAASAPDLSTAPIAIENDWLWHGGVGSVAACRVFDDPAVVGYVTTNYPQELPCTPAGRTVTRIDAHISTFVDANGARGAGWMVLPSSDSAEDGELSVLTCRPTAGLTAADCDTIIADFVARNDAAVTTPTTAATTTNQPAAVSSAIADPPFTPSSWAATPDGMVIAQGVPGGALAAYDVPTNSWRTIAPPPFTARPVILTASGNHVFVAGL